MHSCKIPSTTITGRVPNSLNVTSVFPTTGIDRPDTLKIGGAGFNNLARPVEVHILRNTELCRREAQAPVSIKHSTLTAPMLTYTPTLEPVALTPAPSSFPAMPGDASVGPSLRTGKELSVASWAAGDTRPGSDFHHS